MTKKEKLINWTKINIVYIAAFFLPVLIMTGVAIAFGVTPFGNRSFAIIDALHQYMPFFAEYHEKIRNLDSFFYSFTGGLGYNFLALWSYYLSSPLNLLLLLFPKTGLNLGFGVLLTLKIGLMGLTTAIYFASLTNKGNKKILLFSTAFALSGYIVGYSWNIMWLDSIIMFPLVLLGFDKMMREGDGRKYSIFLALAMIGNFYIAFMICIFLVFWFLFYKQEGMVSFLKNGIRFAFYSILSAMLAAVGLIPAYLGLMGTASADHMELPEHEWYTNIFKILRTHLAGVEPITNDNFDGNANLYIGMLTIFLVVLYFLAKEIRISEKIKRMLLLALFVVSFNEKILNFIWHGFHNQYGIPNRFAFLYLFLLILTAFEAVMKIEHISVKRLIPAVIFSAGLVLLFELGKGEEPDVAALILALALVLLYGSLFLWRKAGRRKKLAMIVIFLVSTVEIGGMAFYGFGCNGQIRMEKFYWDTEAVEALKEDLPQDELVRTCLISARMLDEDIWHGLKSVGIFGSTARGGAVSMMDHWGFFTAANEYLYKGATPLTNLIFNVGYNVRRGDDKNLNDFTIAKTYENMDLLKNPYETSIGYGVEGNLEDWNYKTVYPFDVQNSFVREAYGSEDLFHVIEITDPEIYDGSITRTNRGEYSFTYEECVEDNMVFTIVPEEEGDLYIHYDGSRVENTIIKVDEETRVNDEIDSEIYHVGLVEAGSEVKLYMQMKDDGTTNGVVRLSAAMFDHERFQKLYERMIGQSVIVDHFTSSSLEGSITMEQDGLILFSIPYDEGWTVMLDGEEAEISAAADGMLCVAAEAGWHEISMNYVSPGFVEGLCVTGLGLLLLCIVTIFFRKRNENFSNF